MGHSSMKRIGGRVVVPTGKRRATQHHVPCRPEDACRVCAVEYGEEDRRSDLRKRFAARLRATPAPTTGGNHEGNS